MNISELMDGIRKQDLVLPEFQREYVWGKEQAKQLLVSLAKGYPVGGLLFWKTDSPPDLKNVDEAPERLGTFQVILDGQQRLTTLYMLLRGDVPPFYRVEDLETDPRDLYYDVNTGDFQYYQASRMKGNPVWVRVVDCFSSQIRVFDIAKEVVGEGEDPFKLAEHFHDNLARLLDIAKLDIPLQTVPVHASLDDSIDIFDRVNSKGTKLSDADLALTHATGKWSTARREMKALIDELSTGHFYFDLTFMTRALTGVVCKRALFETLHDRPRDQLEAGWDSLKKILQYVTNTLPQQAFIHSTEDLNTTNVLVPLVVYLSLNDGHFPNEQTLRNAVHWLYSAHIWARYTAQTDQRLEHDVSLIVREESPWEALRERIIDQRGRIEVKSSDFEGRWVQHPLYRAVYILAKAHKAVDWFNGSPLGTTQGEPYKIHNHHIFPQSVLYKSGFDPDNHLHVKIVNEIANRAFLTAETNLSISNRLPEDYLPEVADRYPDALAHQFIPIDPALWKVSNYREFLEARRGIMTRKLNEFMNCLLSAPEPTRERPISELIRLGESLTLEFKSTLQWDIIRNESNKGLRHSVLKTIDAFLNTEGGTLIIGADDNGGIYGLQDDLKVLQGSTDQFAQLLASLITEHLGPQYGHLVKTRFDSVDERQVCRVDVSRAPEPVFLKGGRGKEFYIRVGNTSRALDPEQTVAYVEMNWQ